MLCNPFHNSCNGIEGFHIKLPTPPFSTIVLQNLLIIENFRIAINFILHLLEPYSN
jgi:hypothetical protein